MKKHLTYSNVVASIALVMAMTGGAYAANMATKNSVNSASIKDNTVTTKDVKDRSLKARDFAKGQLPAGATGAAGAQGSPGTAKAFGLVNSDGTVDAARSSSNLIARLEVPGVYCLRAQGVNVKILVATLDSSTSKNSDGDNEWGTIDVSYPGQTQNNFCDPGEAQVQTWYAVTPGPDIQRSNSAFHVVIE